MKLMWMLDFNQLSENCRLNKRFLWMIYTHLSQKYSLNN